MVLYELGITSEELQTAREITEKVPALLNVLRSPLVTSEKKHHLIERVFDGSGLPRHLINFYKVMCNDGGIEELADIYAEWQKIWILLITVYGLNVFLPKHHPLKKKMK